MLRSWTVRSRSGEHTGREPRGDRDVRRLGILVVYYLRTDDDLPLLQLHLNRITRHTPPTPYTVFAATNRMSDSGPRGARGNAAV